MKIAVIGSGIAGLACAWRLAQSGRHVTLFEANDYFGGHSHTVDVSLEGMTYGVDTGFLVFNHQTYPQLVQLFQQLDVETVATDMSFSVKAAVGNSHRPLEWAGASLDAVFAQRRNLLSPRFLRMLRDILRFNRQATALASDPASDDSTLSLGDFLQRHRYSVEFSNWYLLPMAGCIWSCPTQQMLDFPIATFVRFCHNHGLLQVTDRPRWYTVKGGSRHYVDKLLDGIPDRHLNTPVRSLLRTTINGDVKVALRTDEDVYLFDEVVLACHSDQALELLTDANDHERQLLAAIRYQPNRAVLHTDASVLPLRKKTWSAWNYESLDSKGAEPQVCVHYLINQLQPLPFKTPVIVSLNPVSPIDRSKIINSFDYAHPVFDLAATQAQKQLGSIQGQQGVWFAGAWTGYGFHEDGLKSGLTVATAIAERSSEQQQQDAA
ncbi:FAD-dependent oxidoreductase [Herbaspirillum sp. RTI4]|uniref:NAD(P)/FAD-dependent oxidoreductase n=1 Tax=Herbaspirillum sp. RTI4 TaxID=3048640 RepID=UPI002AB5861A|nr:FAD-dependent oxidoreductase [Herbaspirillum sp. RTI4]MDY7579479.1 FAD-dependent oxidoreductase [Herbaspirillum sp. RTI4]MEA9980393.1 FAD-dependent oxidoreductase [Herbaspirillum sp. RTI4]